MKAQLIIQTHSLKSFLQLFDRNDRLQNFEYGDTGYKKEGYVDERIFNGLHRVEDILTFDYDFTGYLIFQAEINSLAIELESDYSIQKYKVCGEYLKLRNLINKMIELNAYNAGSYIYSYICQVYE